MHRRTFLGAGVALGAGSLSGTPSEAAVTTEFANPLDREILAELAFAEREIDKMSSALLAAQTTDRRLRDGFLYDMRLSLGMLQSAADHIGYKAWEQAMEINPDIYRRRRYRSHSRTRRAEAIVALRKAGWSWEEATDIVEHDPAVATGIAAAFIQRERAGDTFLNWPHDNILETNAG